MKFGLSLFGTHPKDKPSPENFQHVLELTRAARDAGFHLVHAGHHYMVRDFQKFQVIPALSRVAADSGDMLLSVLELLPLNHPVRVAEEIATMDAITDGKIIFTPALGYVDHDFQTFGVDKRKRRSIYLESLDVIKKLWTEQEVNHRGRHFTVEHATINPKPVQQPRPAIWQPADASAGIIRAAEYGDVWLISNHHQIADVQEQVALYRKHLVRRDDFDDHGIRMPIMRYVYVSEDQEEAQRIGRAKVEAIWGKYYKQMGQAAEMDNPDDFNQDIDSLMRDRFIFGTPEYVVEEIARFQEAIGFDLLMVNGAGTHEQQLRSLELLGEKVLPEFS